MIRRNRQGNLGFLLFVALVIIMLFLVFFRSGILNTSTSINQKQPFSFLVKEISNLCPEGSFTIGSEERQVTKIQGEPIETTELQPGVNYSLVKGEKYTKLLFRKGVNDFVDSYVVFDDQNKVVFWQDDYKNPILNTWFFNIVDLENEKEFRSVRSPITIKQFMEENNGKVISIFPSVEAKEENSLAQLEIFIKSRINTGINYHFVFTKEEPAAIEYTVAKRMIFDVSEYYGIKDRVITNFHLASYAKALLPGATLLKTEDIVSSFTGEKFIVKTYNTNEYTTGTFTYDANGELLELMDERK